MTKPWDEEWIARPEDRDTTGEPCAQAWLVTDANEIRLVAESASEQHARLASAAPDMARVLIAIEWSGRADCVGDGGYACCPTCEGVAEEDRNLMDAVRDVADGRTVVGHKAECALSDALKKAGVR